MKQSTEIPEKFLSPYNSQTEEATILLQWEKSGLFSPDICVEQGFTPKEAPAFAIVLPPPNITGILHMGHACMITIQDIMVRYARMKGFRTLWIPGTDHAAIATQSNYEKILVKENKRRSDYTREAFFSMVNEYALKHQDLILEQVRRLGASVDWSRKAFTLDEQRSLAVRTAFKMMYEDGLIYRGDRIVNWDPKGQTVVSDDELVYKEEIAKFYYFQFGPFIIGTARPETKFKDSVIVVHPDDKRYTKYTHGQILSVPWVNGTIQATIIKDSVVDPEMGTGAMTITPWHSVVDFDLAQKYNLQKEQIIDFFGRLLPVATEFSGMKIKDARENIVEKYRTLGLLIRIEENYKHSVATAERTGGVIEPQIMRQWFIDTQKSFIMKHSRIDGIPAGSETTLKNLMLHVVKTKQIDILPERFEKVYFNWIENLRDWCISRQIIYGHQIPVWYRGDEIYVGVETPTGEDWTQDSDTLDTWFSSGLWSFSTLGWPGETMDLSTYHPTTVLVTGYDIIFFWVARMVLMTTYILGEIPFKHAYFHGLVRDEKGRKISKSLGNNIDPIEITNLYGTDAIRMSLIVGTAPGQDVNVGEAKFKTYKKFANKMWNIHRFVLENINDVPQMHEIENEEYKTYLKEFSDLLSEITDHMETFKFYLAGERLYHYVWHELADTIIERTKKDISEDSGKKEDALLVLYITWNMSLRMLHPFMPFITETLWNTLPREDSKLLLISSWPTQEDLIY